MLCKVIKNKMYWYILMLAGAASVAFGITGILREPELSGNIAMLMGMFTGLGCVFFIFSIIRLLYLRFGSAAKLKAEEINKKDERNIQIMRAAGMAANLAAMLLLAVMAFVFVWMDHRIPGIIAAGAIWVQAIVFLIAERVYGKKM